MKIAPMGEVRNNFAKYLVACESEPIFITKNGKITAVIEHIDDDDMEDYLLERSPRFRRMLDRAERQPDGISLKAYRKKRGI